MSNLSKVDVDGSTGSKSGSRLARRLADAAFTMLSFHASRRDIVVRLTFCLGNVSFLFSLWNQSFQTNRQSRVGATLMYRVLHIYLDSTEPPYLNEKFSFKLSNYLKLWIPDFAYISPLPTSTLIWMTIKIVEALQYKKILVLIWIRRLFKISHFCYTKIHWDTLLSIVQVTWLLTVMNPDWYWPIRGRP